MDEEEDYNSVQYWRRAVDGRSGRVYYYNKVTRETRWDAPFGSEEMFLRGWSYQTTSSSASSASSSPSHSALRSSTTNAGDKKKHVVKQPIGPTSVVERDTDKIEEREMEIREAVDPKSGKTYYYDRKTRKTFWHDPRLSVRLSKEEDKRPREKQPREKTLGRERELERSERLAHIERALQRFSESEQQQEQEEDLLDEDAQLQLKSSTLLTSSSPSLYGAVARNPSTSSAQPLSSDEASTSSSHSEDVSKQVDQLEAFNHEESLFDSAPHNHLETSRQEEEPHGETMEQVRSSLVLLKQRMSNKNASKRPMSALTRAKHAVSEQVRPRTAVPTSLSIPMCSRRSGCECEACTRGPSPGTPTESLTSCKHCNRKFTASALMKHESVCQKVFSTSPVPSPSTTKSVSHSNKASRTNKMKGKGQTTNWRAKSMQLRQAMSQTKGVSSIHQKQQQGRTLGSTMSTTASSMGKENGGWAEDNSDGLVPCPHCNRTYNPKTAERHIPKCAEIKAKPTTLLRGSGKGAYLSAKTSPGQEKVLEGFDNSGKQGNKPRNARLSTGAAERSGSFGGRSSGRLSLPSSSFNSFNRNRIPVSEKGIKLEPCPYCGRQFGKKAFDRHLEHCAKVKAEKELKAGPPPRTKHGAKETERSQRELMPAYQPAESLEAEIEYQVADMIQSGEFSPGEEEAMRAFLRREIEMGRLGVNMVSEYNYEYDNYEYEDYDDVAEGEDGPFEYMEARDSLVTNT